MLIYCCWQLRRLITNHQQVTREIQRGATLWSNHHSICAQNMCLETLPLHMILSMMAMHINAK